MKAHLHVHDGDAHLELVAETKFERQALAMCNDSFPNQSLHIQVDRYDYESCDGRIKAASAIIHFEPAPDSEKAFVGSLV